MDLPELVSGNTYVMYHGTTWQDAEYIQATRFHRSRDGMLGRGIYLSRLLEKARYYPVNCPESEKVVIEVLVNVGNVIPIDYRGHPRQKTWHDSRYSPVYDTAWVPPRSPGLVRSDLEVVCVWDPRQIIEIIEIIPQ